MFTRKCGTRKGLCVSVYVVLKLVPFILIFSHVVAEMNIIKKNVWTNASLSEGIGYLLNLKIMCFIKKLIRKEVARARSSVGTSFTFSFRKKISEMSKTLFSTTFYFVTAK